MGTLRDACSNHGTVEPEVARTTSGTRATNSAAYLRKAFRIAVPPRIVNPFIAPAPPPRLLQPLVKRCEASQRFGIVRGEVHEHADTPYALALLRARRERPRGRSAAEQRDELAPPC